MARYSVSYVTKTMIAVADTTNYTDNGYANMLLGGSATQLIKINEVYIGGEDTASTPTTMSYARDSRYRDGGIRQLQYRARCADDRPDRSGVWNGNDSKAAETRNGPLAWVIPQYLWRYCPVAGSLWRGDHAIRNCGGRRADVTVEHYRNGQD